MTSIQDVKSAAAQYAAIAARHIDLDVIAAEFPDPRDVAAIHLAILSANMHLEWNDPPISRKVRVIAIMGSPILLLGLVTVWVGWKVRARVDRLTRGKG